MATFSKSRKIDNRLALTLWIRRIQRAVQEGELEQIWPKRYVTDSTEAVLTLDPDGVLPDYIGMYFRETASGRVYSLSAETYHGTGGAWDELS